jgi:uncharacterized membrane protein HdeD (DUF308 family)
MFPSYQLAIKPATKVTKAGILVRMISAEFTIIAAIINLIGCIGYARDTLTGRTKPNRVGWSLWATAPLIAFAAQISQGVGWQSLMTLSAGLGPALVLAASFANKNAYWKLKRFDWFCGGLSVLALIMWLITGEGNVAIMFAIVADVLACVPTLVKAYTDPDTESPTAFIAGVIASVITLLTITAWTIEGSAFPIYLLIANAAIAATILVRSHILTRRASPN